MNLPSGTVLAACALCVSVAGCSGVPAKADAAPEAAKIAVYESEPPGHRPYSVVKSIWVASWRSVGIVPSYRSPAEGAADFRDQAVALGGDAVSNFNCYRLDANIPLDANPKLFCNGRIIKYLQ